MGENFKSLSAIFPLIVKDEENCTKILLHRRQNTGYQDGKWDIAGSCHVDEGETATEAAIRECREEIGITVKSLEFAHLSHRLSKEQTYYDIHFLVTTYDGTPTIMEPNKCSILGCFVIDNLPSDIIKCRKQDIQNYLSNKSYSEKIEHI